MQPLMCLIFWILLSLLALTCCGPVGRLAGLASLLPLIAAVVISRHSQSILVWRYLIFSQTFALLAWALLVGNRPSADWRSLLIGLTLVWFGGWAYRHHTWQSWAASAGGVRSAVLTLDDWRNTDEPVIVADPHLYFVVLRYVANQRNVFVSDLGFDYTHYQGAPLLQHSDYRSLDALAEGKSLRFFVMHQPNWLTETPNGWYVRRMQQFEDRVGHVTRIIVRELERDTSKE